MQGNLSIRLTRELLDRMNSPNLQNEEPEDDEPEVCQSHSEESQSLF